MPIYPYSFQLPPLNVQDIPNDGVAGEFLGISAGGVLDWLPVASGGGDLLAANNLSELTATAGTARTNLGLGTGDTPTFKNLVISTGSIATSAPVTISQTWDALAVAFTAFKVNATSTNSAAASLLLDLQEGGVSKLSVLKNGDLSIRNTGQIGTPNFLIGNSSSSGIYFASGDLRLYVDASSAKFAMSSATTSVKIGSNYSFGWSGGTDASQTLDTILVRDGAPNTLALRNSTAAQTFNVYGTWTTATTNFERLAIKYNVSDLAYQIAAEKGSTNGDYRPLDFVTGGSRRMTIGTNGYVGIGTTAPSHKLQVAGGGAIFESTGASTFAARAAVLTFNRGDLLTTYLNKITSSVSGGPADSTIAFDISNGASTTVTPLVLNGNQEIGLGGNITTNAFAGASMVIKAGNVGIGTTAPSSKLQVSAGDVEVDTIAKGVILKSPDGTRYRVTVANGGTLSVAAV
jgi:hypothetical protein